VTVAIFEVTTLCQDKNEYINIYYYITGYAL